MTIVEILLHHISLLLSIYLNIDLSINNFLNMSRNIIGLLKLKKRRFSEAHGIYMSSSLVFQSKELQTELPVIGVAQIASYLHYTAIV